MPKLIVPLLLCLAGLLLMACGSSQAATEIPLSEAEARGEMLFRQNGCQACHAVQPGVEVPDIGPNLANSAAISAQSLADPNYTGQAETVTEYIEESILHPEIYITPGYEPVMPNTYTVSLSEADLAVLIEYLEGL